MTTTQRSIPTYSHTDECRAHYFQDNDECTCGGFAHRAFGRLGSFTIHAPADYQPRHAAP